jgi:hypothetical protein
MAGDHIQKLLIAAAFALVTPGIGYLIGLMWSNAVAKAFGSPPNPKNRRVWATFCLASTIFLLCSVGWLGSDVLHDWWIESPLSVSAFGVVCFVVLPAALILLIARIWRPPRRAPHP